MPLATSRDSMYHPLQVTSTIRKSRFMLSYCSLRFTVELEPLMVSGYFFKLVVT